jgi:hypothetical protein
LAATGSTSYKSTITIASTVGQVVQDMQIYGDVHSPKGKCIPDRKVEIFSMTPNGLKLIDVDRTSRNGFFFGGGDFGNNVNGAKVKVLKRTIGRAAHEALCKSDADTLLIA